ncbi:hypothetical protein ACJ72_03760 [Emergomyces africanus]|uniref:Uncharacterized protein n=1 Tax=Emergomyces africanus TaxID=1955775 RepID=A0A1B7NYP4_9EURO|nr:hypothetical protein ACJ72_03760 [Emergomyces africanus]
MAHALKRGFQTSARMMIEKSGSFADIGKVNGTDGPSYTRSVEQACERIEKADGRIAKVNIQQVHAN